MNMKISILQMRSYLLKIWSNLFEENNHGYVHVLIFVVGFFVYGVVAVLLGQDNNWDLRNYHLYNPYAFLNGRLGFDYAPAQLQSFHNPIVDLPFYFLVTHLKPVLVGFFMGAVQGLNFGLIFAIAFQVLFSMTSKVRIGLSVLFAAMGMYAPVFIAEFGATENDTLTTLFVLTSVLIITRTLTLRGSFASSHGRKSLIAAGILLGIGAGLKLTVLIYAVGATLALLFVEKRWKNSAGIVAVLGVSIIIGLLISRGHWMATMWSTYGNPVFPFYNSIFKSPYYDLVDFNAPRYMPKSFLEGLTYPFQFLTRTAYTHLSNDFRDSRYAVIYSLITFYFISLYVRWVLGPRRRKKERKKEPQVDVMERFLLAFFIISYITWQIKFSIIRYLAPLEAMSPIIVFILTRHIFHRSKVQGLVVGAAFLVIVAVVEPPIFQRLPWSATFFEVEPPQFEDPDDTIVIIAGRRPWAYLIPFFQHRVRFVRIGGNFTHPSRPNRMQADMRALLEEHAGPIYLLSRQEYLRADAGTLSAYQLYLTSLDCLPIRSRHERGGLCLWPVTGRSG